MNLSSFWIFVFYAGVLIFSGSSLLRLLRPAAMTTGRKTALSCLTGAALMSLLAWPLSAIEIAVGPWIAGVVILIAVLSRFIPVDQKQTAAPQWTLYETVFFSLGGLLLLGNFAIAAAFPQFEIDLVGHILMKSKILADDTYGAAFYFHDPMFASAHGRYPPLSVFLFSVPMQLGVTSVTAFLAVSYAIIFLTGLILHEALRHWIPRWQSLAWVFVFYSTEQFLGAQYLISSTDVLLGLALLLAGLCLIRPADHESTWQPVFALCLSLALLIKTEAIVIVTLMMAATGIREKRWPWKELLFISMIAGPWHLYRLTLPQPGNGGEYALENLSRIFQWGTLEDMTRTAWDILNKRWNHIFLALPFLCLFLKKVPGARSLWAVVLLTVVSYFVMIWAIIPITPGYSTGFLRLLVHVYPLAIVLAATALAKTLDT